MWFEDATLGVDQGDTFTLELEALGQIGVSEEALRLGQVSNTVESRQP